MVKFAPPTTPHFMLGETLLEVLVSVLVFSVGLVGLAALQISTVQRGNGTARHNTAMQLAMDLAEQVRANPDAVAQGWYQDPTNFQNLSCSDGSICDQAQFTRQSLGYWNASLAARLPGASAQVCRDSTPADGTISQPACDGTGNYVVKLWWTERDQTTRSIKYLVAAQ